MTLEEKLEKAIEFIKHVESIDFPEAGSRDVADFIDVWCSDCGCNCDYEVGDIHEKFVNASYINELKDQAWHVLADITE